MASHDLVFPLSRKSAPIRVSTHGTLVVRGPAVVVYGRYTEHVATGSTAELSSCGPREVFVCETLRMRDGTRAVQVLSLSLTLLDFPRRSTCNWRAPGKS